MALPKRIRIGHATFSVERNDGECEALGSNGHVLTDARRIVVKTGLVPDKEREVLWHETIHAAIGVAGLEFADDAAEERVVAAITGPLLHMLRSNPQLRNYLLQE